MKAVCSTLFFVFASFSWLRAAPPVLDEPVPVDQAGKPLEVPPTVRVGKTLIFPIKASDGDGDALTYRVSSSHPNVLVRVRTGHPKLIVDVSHAGNGTDEDPAFSGTLEFALLRDFAPITSGFIGGFAQAGYFDEQVFHRIADLNPDEDEDGSIIVQGGDPLGTGSGGPGFQFDNEFEVPMLFTGRGQLAMANAGINGFTFRGTNGSQFFITDGHPRLLDFRHTVFGQLLRGWETFAAMTKVPRFPQPPPGQEPPAGEPPDGPRIPLVLDAARVETNLTDALLIITATAPGRATIAVEASDGTQTASRTFEVMAVVDALNSPPFLRPSVPRFIQKDKILAVPFRAVDLENDFLFFGHEFVGSNRSGQVTPGGNPARLIGSAGFSGKLDLGTDVTQYDMTYRGPIDGPEAGPSDRVFTAVSVGDRPVAGEGLRIQGTPAVGLSSAIVARYRDSEPRGLATDFTARINWGDGTAPSVGVITRDPLNPSPLAFIVAGSHTYPAPGRYPLVIALDSQRGQRVTLRGEALITADPIRVFGREIAHRGSKLNSQVVATFEDAVPLLPQAYTARIHWGDGTAGTGVVRRAKSGGYEVLGTTVFADAQPFATVIEVSRAGAPKAVGWGRVVLEGFTGKPHLPPFKAPNLIGQMSRPSSSGGTARPPLQTNGINTFAPIEIVVLNSGSKKSAPAKLRFYLSEDKRLNLEDERAPDPDNPGQTIVLNRADIPVKIGTLKQADIASLPPGGGIRYVLDKVAAGDFRLRFPLGENGRGMTLLAHVDYTDPIADHLPIPRTVAFGPYDPFLVEPTTVRVREAAGADAVATFRISLLRQPRGDVSIPVSIATGDQTQVKLSIPGATAEDPPIEFTQRAFVFTPQNWNTPQVITVAAIDDEATDGTKTVRITLDRATSEDPRFNQQDPADVTVTVLDKLPPPAP
jgi:cyclophilin family peptidyl-prolyl cis-trans isomerase